MGIRDLKGSELVERLNRGEISVLEMLDAAELKTEMRKVGLLCSDIARLSMAGAGNCRMRAQRILSIVAPFTGECFFPEHPGTVVVGFNHPSLGEICRLVCLGMRYYGEKEFLFPVNLPWYEAMTGILPELRALGIRITPMITPSTERKLRAIAGEDAEKQKDVTAAKMIFDRRYVREVKSIAEDGGVVFVAPSATRQEEIIGDYVHPSLTAIANIVKHHTGEQALFVPVAVMAPSRGDRGLNLLRRYRIYSCECFVPQQVTALIAGRDRQFDFTFLQRIERTYLEQESRRKGENGWSTGSVSWAQERLAGQ